LRHELLLLASGNTGGTSQEDLFATFHS